MKKRQSYDFEFYGNQIGKMDRRDYIENFVKTCKLARQTGSPILEVNFSCPNFGKEGLICNDVKPQPIFLEALSKTKGNIPLLVKIGYFGKQKDDP